MVYKIKAKQKEIITPLIKRNCTTRKTPSQCLYNITPPPYIIDLPKHLERFVCLSMKTLAEMTFPNGQNAWASSWSENSCGRWYMKRLAPSGPSTCLPAGLDEDEALNPAAAVTLLGKPGKSMNLPEIPFNPILFFLSFSLFSRLFHLLATL